MHPHLHFIYLLPAAYLVVTIVTVADCLRSNNQNKIGWIALIVLLPFLGPIFYSGFAQGRFISEI